MTERRATTLLELMLVIALMEILVVHIPDIMRRAFRAERRADAALDATAVRTAVSRRLRADLDAATRAQAAATARTVLLAGPGAHWVLWTAAGGALHRVDETGLTSWAGFDSAALALTDAPRARLLEVTLRPAGGPPLQVSRAWPLEVSK